MCSMRVQGPGGWFGAQAFARSTSPTCPLLSKNPAVGCYRRRMAKDPRSGWVWMVPPLLSVIAAAYGHLS